MALTSTSSPISSRGLKRGAARLFGIGGTGSGWADARAMFEQQPPRAGRAQNPACSGPPIALENLCTKSFRNMPNHRDTALASVTSTSRVTASSTVLIARPLLDGVVGSLDSAIAWGAFWVQDSRTVSGTAANASG